MALIIKDRVKEITTTTGTGAVSLGGSSATFDAFQSVMSNGDTTFYAIVHTASGTDEWEVGLGTWNTGNTLTRTTVYAGSNGTSAVNFSSGNKDIFMTYPASKAAVAGEDVTFADVTATDITATGTVTLAGDPTSALQAATKEYVDTIAAAGIHYHTPVRVEAPSALTATYDNGTSGVGATLTNSGTQAALVIDGVTLSTSDRVLVYNQTNAAHNGIYTVTNTGSASTNWVLTRATDADSYGASDPDALGEGDAYFVKEGDTGAGELYVMNTSGVITFGTTNITFTVIAETAVYSAGTGLTLTGTTFSTNQDISTSASPTFNNITVTGTVDGRDVATDGSKLDGIEAGATADQTASEIKTAYESNSDTNAFTDAEQTKLSGIETGATGDQTASEILTAIKTVDGAGSNLDADLLDGQQGSYYLNTSTTFSGDVSGTYNNIVVANDSHTHDGRYYTETEADSRFVNVTGDSMTGALTIATTGVAASPSLAIDVSSSSAFVHSQENLAANLASTQTNILVIGKEGSTKNSGYLGFNWSSAGSNSNYVSLGHWGNDNLFRVYGDGTLKAGASNVIFHDGYHPNADKWTTARTLSLSGDASGSVSWDGSANATLSVTVANDSHTHSNYITNNANDTSSGTIAFGTGTLDPDSYTGYSGGFGNIADGGGWIARGVFVSGGTGKAAAMSAGGGNLYFGTQDGTNANSMSTWLIVPQSTKVASFTNTPTVSGSTIWHAGNDGSGSGLDADLLDGVHGSSFLRSDAADTATGIISFGPSSWSKYLKIGGSGNNSDSNNASIGVTNGNLHIDAAQGGFATYLNFYDGTAGVAFGNGAGSSPVAWMGPDGDLWKGSADNTGSKYWHAGNDGSGSGLDADTVDGVHESTFMRKSANSALDMNQYDITDGNTIYMDNWYRSYGTTGWYNQTYGGGIYMTDSTFVRVYNSKAFQVDNTGTGSITTAGGIDVATQIAIGSEVILQESTDRADLLQITSSTSGWGGLQIRNSSNEGRWSFMTDGEAAGIYNDEDGQWHILMYEVAGTDLYYNGSHKFGTTSYGAVVKGDGGETLTLQDTGDTHFYATAYLYFKDSAGTAMGYLGKSAYGSYDMTLHAASGGDIVLFTSGSLKYSNGSTEYNIWHAANDGAGSGLDADLWDGNQFSTYLNQAVLSTSSPSFAGLNINGNLNAVDNIYLAGTLYHEGDTNTFLSFGTDSVAISAGGSQEITVTSTGVQLGDTGNGYFQPVSGNYGSIQIDGGAHGGYEGYSIGARVVLMHNNASAAGIYNDVSNEWMVYTELDGYVGLYYNGSEKIRTTSTGITVTGTVAATSYTGDGSSLTGISAGATGGGSDEIFWENGQTVTTNYTITNGKNAMSAGPITVNSGVTVTVGSGETWTVV